MGDRERAVNAPDLRALVTARLAELGIDQAEAARRVAPAWGCRPGSAASRLSRWMRGARDMTTDALADLLGALGLTLTPDAHGRA